jgi:predicted phage terminase large subunit-like protein
MNHIPPPPAAAPTSLVINPITGAWEPFVAPIVEDDPVPIVPDETDVPGFTLEELNHAQEIGARHDFQLYVIVMHRELKGSEFDMRTLHLDIIDFLNAAYRGEFLNGYTNIPPRHGKTYLFCLWISFCYGQHADCKFLYATATAELAEESSVAVQEMMNTPLYKRLFKTRINPKAAARDRFSTTKGGQMISRGTQGQFTGFGAGQKRAGFSGGLIFDDLHKPGESASDAAMNAVRVFFTQVFWSRRNNSDRVPCIGIGQRVAPKDIFGMIDPKDGSKGLVGVKWKPLIIAARNPAGKAIYPETYSTQQLDDLEESQPWLYWTQYMQAPYNLSGTIFKTDMMPVIDVRPTGTRMVCRGWDLAARELRQGKTEPDFTASVLLVYYPESQIYVIEDAFQFQKSVEVVRDMILNTAHRDGLDVKIRIPQDPAQAGLSQATDLVKMLNGYKVNTARMAGDKVVNAEPVAAQMNRGLIAVLSRYAELVRAQLQPFPDGAHDDMVDALSAAYHELAIPDEDEASRRQAAANLAKIAQHDFGPGLERQRKDGSVDEPKVGYLPNEASIG